MDNQRFDEISRSLATTGSRRGLLKGLAGGALAGALSLVGASDAAARKCRNDGKNCKSDTECCSLYCDPTSYTCAPAPPADTCDPACPTGAVCVDGACFCPVPTSFCGTDGCVDLQTDDQHCGTCTTVCATGATCVAGICTCPTGQTECNGACVDLNTDEANCGSCGRICNSGETCSDGACCELIEGYNQCCYSGNPAICRRSYDCDCTVFGCQTCYENYPCCV